jgi:hypothetical protein
VEAQMGRFSGFKDKIIADGPWNTGKYADSMCKEMMTHIRKVTIEVF